MNAEPVIPSVDERLPVHSTQALHPHPVGSSRHCIECSEAVAHWWINHPRYGAESVDICALCFLYTSGWLLRERVLRVDQVARVIGLKRQKLLEFVKGENGDRQWPPRLVHVKDADDVLGAITLHDRFESVMRRKSA